MKKIIIVFIIIIILVGITVFFLVKNDNNIENKSNMPNMKENKIMVGSATKIICKNIYKDNTKTREDLYNIINKEKINKIIELLENQELKELYDKKTDEENYVEIKIYNENEEKQLTVYENNSIALNEQEYNVNSELYKNLINILNPTYYLHNSDLELPNQENCIKMQEKALNQLNENEISEISKKLREAHVTMEYLLIDGIRNLKQSNSVYWDLYNEAEIITEPTGEELEFSKDHCFRAITNNIMDIANIIKDEETKEIFNSIYEKLNIAMENKDIAEMFNIHKKIHDYDYWIINYPAYYDSAPAPDWEGVKTYFGNTI